MADNKCAICDSKDCRRFLLALVHDDGKEKGENAADVETWLCEEHADRVADALVAVIPMVRTDVAGDGARCRICGCTDSDCQQCIAKTFAPCHWVELDHCDRRPCQQAVGLLAPWAVHPLAKVCG